MQAAPTEAQIARLYEQHASFVHAWCRAVLRNEDEAWEATQEVFAQAISSWENFGGQSTRGTWLYRVATNHCLDVDRARHGPGEHPMSTQALDQAAMTGLHARRNPPAPGPSNHALRRLAAGDLPDGEAREIRAAMHADPSLQARFAAEQELDRRFLEQHPFSDIRDRLVAQVGAVPALQRRPGLLGPFLRPRSLLWAIAAVVTALLLAVVVPEVVESPEVLARPRGADRSEGSVITAWHDAGGAAVILNQGARLGEGDALRFTVSSARSHMALLGVDGAGAVSSYVPVGGGMSMPREPGARPLDDELVLDGASGPEVFLAFLSDEALLVDDLKRAIRDAVDAGGVRALPDVDWGSLGVEADIGVFVVEKVDDDAP